MTASPFSSVIPNLQVAWDATSLRMLMECPRKYQYGILQGWRTSESAIDLEFGGYFASACEVYKKARLSGKDKQAATIDALRYTFEATWLVDDDHPEGYPWSGRYEEMWRCTGEKPYKNAKGNRAKCPYSHKGVWLPAPGPTVCGECGSCTQKQRQWVASSKVKDRYALLRLVSWYCDEQPETLADGPFPYAFPNGIPAVELSFQMPLPIQTLGMGGSYTRENYILCGHMDSITQFGEEKFIADNKTTRKPIGAAYFAQYTPNIQVDVYDLAGSGLYPSLGIKGVMIEAAQTLQEGAKFGIGIQYRTDALREELLQDLEYWLRQAEKFAVDNYWPMNRASCAMCQFKSVCGKEPQMRQAYLEANYVRREWNPLQER